MTRSYLLLGLLVLLLTTCNDSSTTAQTSVASTNPRPTATILPATSANHINMADAAIEYSYDLLLQQDLESRLGNAIYTQVEFPNGDAGVFVAIGFFGPTHGYQFLYRIENQQVTLVEFVLGKGAWGIKNFLPSDEVGIEVLDLFADINDGPQQVLKVSGDTHAGTGLWEHGYFQIVSVADDGIRVLFDGAETEISANHLGWYRHYQYQFEDLDADGRKEIIKQGEECQQQFVADTLEKVNCEQVNKIYYFNDSEYVERE